tara:strand:+ start:1293 stop:1634 length:342 start_codon:yes stop_codon:yes gene_type:complete
MECGHKSPPGAKFCPGCGISMSLDNKAKVDEESPTSEIATTEIKDITLTQGSIIISGDNEGITTIKQVVAEAGDRYQPQNIVRARSSEFKGLTREQLSDKLREKNRSDGSKEA